MIVLPPRALPALTVIVREFKFTCGTVGYAQLSVVNDMPVPIKPGTKTYELLSVSPGLHIVGRYGIYLGKIFSIWARFDHCDCHVRIIGQSACYRQPPGQKRQTHQSQNHLLNTE